MSSLRARDAISHTIDFSSWMTGAKIDAIFACHCMILTGIFGWPAYQ
jgi:hypothetical protein